MSVPVESPSSTSVRDKVATTAKVVLPVNPFPAAQKSGTRSSPPLMPSG